MKMDLTQGSIAKNLLVFSWPIMLGMLLHTAYNIIDAIYIGMLGPLELAAVSLTFPVVFIFIAVASGLGIGATALISQAIGRKNLNDANNVAEHALFLGGIMGIIIAVLGIIFSPQIFTFMGADAQVLPLTIEYSTPIFIGLIFMFAWFISDAILKAQGNSKTPMRTLGISVGLNIVLSPLLIFGLGPFPAWGLFGAAVATVFSRLVAAILNFAFIYTPGSVVDLSLKAFRPRFNYIKQIMFIGLPASAAQSLTALGLVLLTSIVGWFGSYALAAYGVGIRVSSLATLPLVGLSLAVISFVGQNIGASNFERANKVTLLAAKLAFLIAVFFIAFIVLLAEPVMRVFTQDLNVIAIGVVYLSIVSFHFVFEGLYFVLNGAFQGAGRTELFLITNIVRWSLAVALAFFWAPLWGLVGVWYGIVVSSAATLAAAAIIFYSKKWLPKQSVK
jgi:putative MATE family efflux protein